MVEQWTPQAFSSTRLLLVTSAWITSSRTSVWKLIAHQRASILFAPPVGSHDPVDSIPTAWSSSILIEGPVQTGIGATTVPDDDSVAVPDIVAAVVFRTIAVITIFPKQVTIEKIALLATNGGKFFTDSEAGFTFAHSVRVD